MLGDWRLASLASLKETQQTKNRFRPSLKNDYATFKIRPQILITYFWLRVVLGDLAHRGWTRLALKPPHVPASWTLASKMWQTSVERGI